MVQGWLYKMVISVNAKDLHKFLHPCLLSGGARPYAGQYVHECYSTCP
jgi:hypothetical protein